MTKDTSGPAFPVFPDTSQGHATSFTGMTLRDYFAAKAMLVARTLVSDEVVTSDQIKAMAEIGYKIADAMLEARK